MKIAFIERKMKLLGKCKKYFLPITINRQFGELLDVKWPFKQIIQTNKTKIGYIIKWK